MLSLKQLPAALVIVDALLVMVKFMFGVLQAKYRVNQTKSSSSKNAFSRDLHRYHLSIVLNEKLNSNKAVLEVDQQIGVNQMLVRRTQAFNLQ